MWLPSGAQPRYSRPIRLEKKRASYSASALRQRSSPRFQSALPLRVSPPHQQKKKKPAGCPELTNRVFRLRAPWNNKQAFFNQSAKKLTKVEEGIQWTRSSQSDGALGNWQPIGARGGRELVLHSVVLVNYFTTDSVV